MPLKKISDFPKPCGHVEHLPPSHMVLEPGVYEHTCPGCGAMTVFTVPGFYNQAKPVRQRFVDNEYAPHATDALEQTDLFNNYSEIDEYGEPPPNEDCY